VGLVHDHEVPRRPWGQRTVGVALRGGDRRDQERPTFPVANGSEDRERQLELRFHLLPPLPRQRGGREDQGPADEAPDRILLQEKPRLDRLAEAHLVRKNRTASHLAQDAQACPLLVRIPDDASQGGPREQAVEVRSEERRVGKECRSRWSPNPEKKKKKRGAESGRERRTKVRRSN